MSEPLEEYKVRDFSAVDKQIEEIAVREHVLTNRLKIKLYKLLQE